MAVPHEFFDIDYPGYVPLEISLKEPDDFLKVKETLSRIGVASKKGNELFQSCHILHKQGRYFICHFKEMFTLDGKVSDFCEGDIEKRNSIAKLLQEWGLLKIITDITALPSSGLSQIKIISFKEKENWILSPKYNIGKKY
jgi:hypothetical protein